MIDQKWNCVNIFWKHQLPSLQYCHIRGNFDQKMSNVGFCLPTLALTKSISAGLKISDIIFSPYFPALMQSLCSCFRRWVEEDLTCFAAAVELTWLVQLTEMSGTSNSGYFVCLLWKGCLNGSLVTNSTWRLTPIYPHFPSRVLHPCLPPVLPSSVCVSRSWTTLH